MTAHPVVETRFEQKDVDETHYFAISKSVEYFVKFEVPEHLTEKYNAEPQKHIFQVSMAKLFCKSFLSSKLDYDFHPTWLKWTIRS